MESADTSKQTVESRPAWLLAGHLPLVQKGLLLVMVPILFEIGFLIALGWLVYTAESQAALEARANAASQHCDSVLRHFRGAFSDILAATIAPTEELDKRCAEHIAEIPAELEHIKELVSDDAKETALLNEARAEIGKSLEMLTDARKNLIENHGAWMYLKTHKLTKKFTKVVSVGLEKLDHLKISERERASLNADLIEQTRNTIKGTIAVALLFNIVLAISLSRAITSNMARHIRALLENTTRFAAGKELLPQIAGSDELAQLDASFHQMAAALDEARKREAEAQQLKQKFVAMMGHDIRTPLTIVQGAVSLLKTKQTLSSEDSQIAMSASLECDRMMSMINDLMDISQYEAGAFSLNLVETPLWAVFERSTNTVARKAQSKNITVTFHETELEAMADPGRLQQVLVNLVMNAINACPDNSTIEIAARQSASMIEISVSDNGPGIPDTERDSIFNPFYRLDDSERNQGKGLGLAICKAIIGGHGGAISVDTKPTGGSRFWFTLPAVEQNSNTQSYDDVESMNA